MDSDLCESSDVARELRRVTRPDWFFVRLLTPFGFGAAGVSFFYSVGQALFATPPVQPGQAGCGNQVIGMWLVLFVGTPIVAIFGAAAGMGIGALMDAVRQGRFWKQDDEA